MTTSTLRFDRPCFTAFRVYRGASEVAQIELDTDDEGFRLYRALMLHNDRERAFGDLDMAKEWIRSQLGGCATCGARRLPLWRGQCNQCI